MNMLKQEIAVKYWAALQGMVLFPVSMLRSAKISYNAILRRIVNQALE